MRFKELVESELEGAQLAAFREICASPKGRVGAPTNVVLRCPEFALRAQKVSGYIGSETTVSKKIMEFVILIAARYWTAQFEWYAHHSRAVGAGISPKTTQDLAEGKTPPSEMKPDEAAAYSFCTELHHNKGVSDATFAAARKQFGEPGVVDLIAISGYYTMVSMILNVNQQTLPAGEPLPLKPLKNQIDLRLAGGLEALS